ncbi:uncharacterized protein VTP21DRAFT_10178 [Calcarisporiella thermophila]|uniref:uncharacterized protein n=1 Tax=Calcarisporiella thermophila TaxID=911321 RepID=UPI00374324A2
MSSYPSNPPTDQKYSGNSLQHPAIEEQQRIAASLPPCPKGGNHELRAHYTGLTLFFAMIGLPLCCGFARKKTVCKRCGQVFKDIAFPEPS